MRMHTIPQNVTAYEDKIVGMLVGRQFIYLAVGGVIIFVLLSANVGPLLIRAFLSMLVGGLAAAMALLKPNDRNFDAMMFSYIQAIFGPTEWVWRKDTASVERLKLITDQLAGKPLAVDSKSSKQAPHSGQDNLLRVSRFQTFISERESGMDHEDLEFIEQLNFSEPVPQRAFISINSAEKAPPMLTKQNYNQIKPAAMPIPAPTPARAQPKPLSPIAGNSNQLGATIAVEGRQQGVQLRSNLRTNRSLSRQLLSSGVLTLPVRGERHFDLSDELKDELKEISSYIQSTDNQKQSATRLVSGESVQVAAQAIPVNTPTPPPPAPVATSATPAGNTQQDSPKSERTRRQSDYDWSNTPSVSQQISMLGQAMPNSGITKGSSMSDLPPTNVQANPSDASPAPRPDPVKVVPSSPRQTAISPDDLEQEARQIEAETQKAISDLEKSAQPEATQSSTPMPMNTAGSTKNDTVLTSHYETEINRLKAHSQEMEQKAKQAEAALQQLQQQLSGQPQAIQPSIGAQQELVDKLRQQQAQAEAYRQELEQKMSASSSQSHLHAEYAPLPEVAPVISEQPTLISNEPVQSAPTALIPDTQPPAPVVQPQEAGELDLQAKMAAAGVGTTEQPSSSSSTAVAGDASNTVGPQQKTVALTNQPNIINGTVVDAQGQLISGVIVVVKNAQGESKRALKTNKLGQFVVTTPLANGSYSVEVDKKGLSFDIMKVELSGAVLQPIIIKSKSS